MQEERAASEGQQAVQAAVQILCDLRCANLRQLVASSPQVLRPRTIRIGQIEYELERLKFSLLLIVVALYGLTALEFVTYQSLAQRDDRALTLVTGSDAAPIHLVSEGGFAAGVQGSYWGRSGVETAMLTLSNTAPVPEGTRYDWWVHHGDHWTRLGGDTLFGKDNDRLIATSPELAAPPDAIRVTLEFVDDPKMIDRTMLSWSDQ